MAEEAEKRFGPKRRLTKGQAIGIMAVGGAMLVIPWFIQAEQGSALQIGKVLVGVAGFIALCLGSYYRP
jgi:hypothetical protein